MINKAIIHTVGDFPEGNARNQRIKAVAQALSQLGISTEIRILKPNFHWQEHYAKEGQWNGIPYRFRSRLNIRSGFFRKIHRIWIQFLDHCSTLLTARNSELHYFYTPRSTDKIGSLYAASIRGAQIIVDQTERFSTRRTWPHRWEEKLISKRAHHVLCLSKYTEQYMRSLNGKALILSSNIVVDFERFNNINMEPTTQRIGYLGSFDEKDDVEGIIRAFELAKQQLPDLNLRLIGYDRSGRCAERVKGSAYSTDMVYTGGLDEKELIKELMSCDTLILNRKNDAFSTHGFPIKLGEYFAARRIVILSDIKGYAEDLMHGETVIKFKAEDIQGLSREIVSRYQGKYKVKAIVDNAYRYAQENFSISNLEEQFRSLIKV